MSCRFESFQCGDRSALYFVKDPKCFQCFVRRYLGNAPKTSDSRNADHPTKFFSKRIKITICCSNRHYVSDFRLLSFFTCHGVHRFANGKLSNEIQRDCCNSIFFRQLYSSLSQALLVWKQRSLTIAAKCRPLAICRS